MANLDERYVLTPPLELYFVNKDTGLPLANGEVYFFRDSARNVPKSVYQLTGTPPDYTYTALPNPVQLSAVGTAQNAGGDNVMIYLYPYDAAGNLDLYYVVVRDEFGVEQFTREAWPNITAADDPVANPIALNNQIANPQFSQVFINTGAATNNTVYTVSAATRQVCALAPDWDLVLSGTGSVTVQRIPIPGNLNVPTSPPYALDIEVGSGVTFCGLRQRFNVNSGLWASTHTNQSGEDISLPVYLSGSLTANTQGAPNAGITLMYVPSTVVNPIDGIVILAAAVQDADYQYFTGATEDPIPESTDAQTGSSGYVDIYAIIDNGAHVRLTSIQVMPTNSSQGSANIIPYDLQSSNREQAYMGDYYIPNLNVRYASSLLFGWDFPKNPAQFGATGTFAAATAQEYIWDQTVGGDTATSATYARNAMTGGLQVTTVTNAANAFSLTQFLSGEQARAILGTKLAVNVFAYRTQAGSPVTMRVYLFRGSAAANIPSLPSGAPNPMLGTLATSGEFTLSAANWTAVPRTNLNTPEVLLSTVDTGSVNDINNGANDYGFTGWEVTDAAQIADTDKFAIVVTFGYTSNTNVVTVNSISLNPNAIPSRPIAKSFVETLNDCRYYYEKSYEFATAPGTLTNTGVVFIPAPLKHAGGGTNAVTYHSFPVKYIHKRVPPLLTFYSPASASVGFIRISGWAASAYSSPFDLAIAGWTATSATRDSAWYTANNVTNLVAFAEGDSVEGVLVYHFVADARLGKV